MKENTPQIDRVSSLLYSYQVCFVKWIYVDQGWDILYNADIEHHGYYLFHVL